MKKKSVGIVGCGTIGLALAEVLFKELQHVVAEVYVCDHHADKAVILARKFKKAKIVNLPTLIQKSDIVLESGSVQAAGEILNLPLRENQDVLIMSVGGLLEFSDPLKVLHQKKAHFWIPSGAVSGLDAIWSSKQAGLKSVKLITRKPPQGLDQADYFKKHPFPKLTGDKEVCIFRGSAREAVKNFPQNINVAAVLSIAGLGATKTQVEIWTSKKYTSNQHEVKVFSGAGEIMSVTRNVPSKQNPKTSALAVYSAIASLKNIFSRIRIGA